MAKFFKEHSPSDFPQEVTLSATANTMLRIELPGWCSSVVLTPRNANAYIVQRNEGADGATTPTLAHTTTLVANEARRIQYRNGRARVDYANWPPVLYLGSATASTVVELEVEP